MDLEAGRGFSGQEVRTGQPVIVLGSELASRLFEDLDPVGREVRVRKIPYRVIGVAEPQGSVFGLSLDKFAVAPALSPIKRYVNPPRVLDELKVQAASQEDLQAAIAETEAIMRSRRGLRPTEESNFSIETADAVLDFWENINKFLMTALPGLVSIALVVGGIVIMNIMLMAVAERTREIGIRKSLGARRRDIMRQFLVESATLATVGAAMGIAFGLGMAALVQATTFLPARVAPWSIVVAVLLGAGVGIGAGLYPASRAARLDPVEAIRHE
jgi:putative ABC transport system permease protein